MKTETNKSLKPYNTFGIDANASEFIEINSVSELKNVLDIYKNKKKFILSGGSNMLLTKDIEALVLHVAIKGITIQQENDTEVLIAVNAGENWHEFVKYCIKNNYGGIENLSLIPGYVGSAPIQNIGAYGVELKDILENCEAIEISTGIKRVFSNKECQFDYRTSIFKDKLKGNYIITQVTFRLSKKNHQLRTAYGAIKNALDKKKCINPSIKDISDAVISIRKSKLPDPAKIGNSGSFFKNPIVTQSHFEKLRQSYPDIPSYLIDEKNYKIPAGWLIEQCGFKGKRWGDAGVHKKQALVLINYGNATGIELLELSRKIQQTIHKTFDIILEIEVNII